MHYTRFDGIIFLERVAPTARLIGPINVQVGGMLTSGQLRSLDDVKRIMAKAVRTRRGNAIINFIYGQRSVGFLASLFNRDDVVWYGRGTIAIVDSALFP